MKCDAYVAWYETGWQCQQQICYFMFTEKNVHLSHADQCIGPATVGGLTLPRAENCL